MLKLIKDSYKILRLNSLLSMPFILYLFIMSFLIPLMWLNFSNLFIFLGFFITNFAITVCFLAGWLQLTKNSIAKFKTQGVILNLSQNEAMPIKTLNSFMAGVGQYFLKISAVLILYFLFLYILMVFVYKFSLVLFGGTLPFELNDLASIFQTNETLKSYLLSLDKENLLKFASFTTIISSAYFIYSYLTMFWLADIFHSDHNPFSSLFNAIIFNFKNFILSFGIFLFINFLNMILTFFNVFFASNLILGALTLLIFAYFIAYWAILIFLTYEEKENNCASGADGIRQN